MQAIINGHTVIGTPEEIKQYAELTSKQNVEYNIPITVKPLTVDSGVPEHVKRYCSSSTWVSKGDSRANAFF